MRKYLFGIGVVFLMLACRTNKPVVSKETSGSKIRDSAVAVNVINKVHSFQTMKVKRMQIGFDINGIQDRFKGSLAVARDSLIVISVVPMFGYEVLRIMCARDSIIVINRAEKTYHASSLEYYLRKYNVNAGFSEIMALLSNEAFYYDTGLKNRYYSEKINLVDGRIHYFIESVMNGIKLTRQLITAEDENGTITDVLIEDYMRDMQLSITYEDFTKQDMDAFPGRISVDLRERKNIINLDLEYGQVVFNEGLNVRFTIPENYTRIMM